MAMIRHKRKNELLRSMLNNNNDDLKPSEPLVRDRSLKVLVDRMLHRLSEDHLVDGFTDEEICKILDAVSF